MISLTFHGMSVPGCKPRGPTHCQQINQPGEPEPACWGATNMHAALLDTCESAQDEDSEGILVLGREPTQEGAAAQAGCLCLRLQELRRRLGQGAGLALLLEGWHEHRELAAILPPALGTWVPVPPRLPCMSVSLCLVTLIVHSTGHSLWKSQAQNGKIRT